MYICIFAYTYTLLTHTHRQISLGLSFDMLKHLSLDPLALW